MEQPGLTYNGRDMAKVTSIDITCDSCRVAETNPVPGASLTDGWLKAQIIYAVSPDIQSSVIGYFCPDCIVAHSVPQLLKDTSDL